MEETIELGRYEIFAGEVIELHRLREINNEIALEQSMQKTIFHIYVHAIYFVQFNKSSRF